MSETNLYAAPTSRVLEINPSDAGIDIAALPVSKVWKDRFHLIEKAGGVRLPKLMALSFGERVRVSFNLLAFLFGPIYYIAKGMWKRGLLLFGAAMLVIVGFEVLKGVLGLTHTVNMFGFLSSVLFARLANCDYYKKTVLNQNGWW